MTASNDEQPSNARAPIDVTVDGNETSVNEEHPAKALVLSAATPVGTITRLIDLKLSGKTSDSVALDAGNVTDLTDQHPLKAPVSMVVKEIGSST